MQNQRNDIRYQLRLLLSFLTATAASCSSSSSQPPPPLLLLPLSSSSFFFSVKVFSLDVDLSLDSLRRTGSLPYRTGPTRVGRGRYDPLGWWWCIFSIHDRRRAFAYVNSTNWTGIWTLPSDLSSQAIIHYTTQTSKLTATGSPKGSPIMVLSRLDVAWLRCSDKDRCFNLILLWAQFLFKLY